MSSKKLTATQIRNARKRRSKQKTRKNESLSSKDPSLRYVSNPTSTPIVSTARKFFDEMSATIEFSVFNNCPSLGWRTVVKLAVQPISSRDGSWKLGLFAPNTHTLVPGSHLSAAHHPAINATIRHILSFPPPFPAYSPNESNSSVRYLLLSLERSTKRVQVTFVVVPSVSSTIQTERRKLDKFIQQVTSSHTSNWHSFWLHMNHQNPHCNAIVDTDRGSWECIYHHRSSNKKEDQVPVCEYLTISDSILPGIPLYFPPNVFRQANLSGFAHIVQAIRSYLKQWLETMSKNTSTKASGRCLIELYGGVGTIGLHMSDLFDKYICSDSNPNNPACFERSIQSFSKEGQHEYYPHNAEEMIRYLTTADVILVDPPRKGLEPAVSRALSNLPSSVDCRCHVLVYVSCGFAALQRDIGILLERGRWRIDCAEGHILFPGSDALETLVFFRRVDTDTIKPPVKRTLECETKGISCRKKSKSSKQRRSKNPSGFSST